MRRPGYLAVLVGLVLGLLAGCGDAPPGPGELAVAAGPSTSPSPANPVPLPSGWRWEAYAGVQVGVPGDWGYARSSADQIITQWCIGRPVRNVVARPGATTLVGCGLDQVGDPGTRIAVAGVFVAFGLGGAAGTLEEGDRTTVILPTASVAVQAPPELRQQIVATIHPIERDHNGCPVDHPISLDPGRTPEPAIKVSSLTAVTAVTACKYAIPWPQPAPGAGIGPGLRASVRLTAADAQAAIDRIADAPRGGGPDEPSTCAVDYSYGEDIIVLSVTSGRTTSEIYLRYSGCDHNGFDDGVAVRSLTAEAVRPFVGPNMGGGGISGPREKVEMICPECL